MKISVKKLVTGALMAALCCIATMVIQIPLPVGGYVHPGDMAVFLCAFLPGGWVGAFAAGLGSCLADIFTGYAFYALPTFIIKALMALTVYYIVRNRNPLSFYTILATVAGALVMMVGYFIVDYVILGSVEGGVVMALFGSWAQGAFGVVASYLVLIPLAKSGLLKRYHNLRQDRK